MSQNYIGANKTYIPVYPVVFFRWTVPQMLIIIIYNSANLDQWTRDILSGDNLT